MFGVWMKIEDYSKEVGFQVGERVRVIIKEIPKEHLNCDTGIITAITTRFSATPKMRRFSYHVKFDEPYVKEEKVFYKQIYALTLMDKKFIRKLKKANKNKEK